MRALSIFLGDLSYHNKENSGSLYAPLNIGLISSYIKSKFGPAVEVRLFKDAKALLEEACSTPPDIIGLSFYYWNTELNHLTTRLVRRSSGRQPLVVWGGPSVDSDPAELARLFTRFPEVDCFVPDEGEQGLAAIVGGVLGGLDLSARPDIPGAAYRCGGDIVVGAKVGLSTDLSKIPSPYLDGTLDAFLDGDYLPLLQTSRLCPYTCAFCVSGKNTGKLRSFDMERVKAELDFIAERFRDRPNHRLYIVDENFGILDRDAEVAAHIRKLSDTVGYPKQLFYYNDKKFGSTSRAVHELVGDMCFHGLTLSLQSDNPETLKVIKRRNLSPEALADAIRWGKGKGLPVTTELIVGLPGDSRQTFIDLLERCGEMGFDVVQTYNLIILDGIELNRPAERLRHGIKTKFRPLPGHFLGLDGEFCAETEEVVTETRNFDFDDFCFFRAVNMFYYAVAHYRLHPLFFRFLSQHSVSMARFAQRFAELASFAEDLPPEYHEFFHDFWKSVAAELFDARDQVTDAVRRNTQTPGAGGEPFKINPHFGRMLIRNSAGWVRQVLHDTLATLVADRADGSDVLARADVLLDLGGRERVVDANLAGQPPMRINRDILAWIEAEAATPSHGGDCWLAFEPSEGLTKLCATLHPNGREDALYKMLGQFKIAPQDLLYHLKIHGAEKVAAAVGDETC